MKDEETGSWWQQVTGQAILGSFKGQQLKAVLHDEVSFSIWKQEQPHGRVLRPGTDTAWKRFSEDWEAKTAKMPTPLQASQDTTLNTRAQVVGIKVDGRAKAYPLAIIQERNPVLDMVGDMPVLVVAAEDKKSVRAFDRRLDGQPLEFFRKTDSTVLRLVDAQTGSEWDFSGKSVSGHYVGRQMTRIYALNDYWFDWKTYNPATSVYR